MPANSWKLAPGLNNVGSYQVSGAPFVSGTCLAPVSGAASFVLRFPAVTKWFQIEPKQTMLSRELRVAFSQNGLHNNNSANFRVHMSSSFKGPVDMKISELWFMTEDNATFTFDVMAGLTSIQIGSVGVPDRTNIRLGVATSSAGGPNWTGSSGVG